MRARFPFTVLFGTIVMILMLGNGYGEGESNSTSSCVNSLIPCTAYVTNASAAKPPSSCCGPLLSALVKQTQCLCNLLNSNAIASLGVTNVSEALDLPAKCGSNLTTSICTTKENGNKETPSNGTTPSQGDTSASASSSHLPTAEVLALFLMALLLSPKILDF
ncbi:hypothetical protein SUGI_0813550 [Cryptomeria japonica]|uniref:non-specific lipid transfer protein GPI-anchored 9 n=1 Tax=Cryptomeria japonica TaxID=3369 RepID=UPI002414A754|nr:non-specific lipid transfer protein GPI-anchored 9 [Cryptomeria japonica]GLJ39803.1 hypothetical protein SUGI_0813550 [Cryptomeria japonica]